MADAHRLVILGGGVAGLDIASHVAGRRGIAVTLIDREPAYVWKPMLHTIAAGTADAGAQETTYLAQARARGFLFVPGEATGIDRARREVRLAPFCIGGEQVLPERTIGYDTLILAVGSRANDFGTSGVAEHCARIDSRSDAIAFNDRLRIRLLRALAAGGTLSIGIVGGGATGVELAAELIQLADIADHYGASKARERVHVTLIESGPRLLGPFPEDVSRAAAAKLAELGVEVRTSAKVKAADATGFTLADDSRILADLRIWAAGVRAPDVVAAMVGLEHSKAGQIVVGPTLAAIGDPHIYAVGDCAAPRLPGREEPVPTTAQAAHQAALYLCRHLPTLIAGKRAPDFRYHDFGSLVSLGGYDAYGSLGRFGLFKGGFIRGKVAQLGHAMLYRSFQARLHGFWRGGLLWLSDTLAARVRPSARLG